MIFTAKERNEILQLLLDFKNGYNNPVQAIDRIQSILSGTDQAGEEIENFDKYYPVICHKCKLFGMSNECEGGGQIADTGDYSDIECPDCSTYVDDLSEIEYYKLRTASLRSSLEQSIREVEEMRKEIERLKDVVNDIGDEINIRCTETIEISGIRFFGIAWPHIEGILSKYGYVSKLPF